MADLAQLIGSLPPDQREALKRQLVGKFQTAEPPSWKPPQWVPEMAVGMLPGAGDAMSAMDSVSAGQRMADAWRAGDYGGAAGAGLEALGHGLGVLPFFPSMVKAYHGSPHRFDQFSLDKIGTGEGAQAYGHGLYFAENPKVAGSYRDAGNTRWLGITPRQLAQDAYDAAVKVGAKAGDDAYTAARDRLFKKWQSSLDSGERQRFQEAYDNLVDLAGPKAKPEGALYNVSLDVEPEDLLDWDAPLSQQSEKVRKALERLGVRQGTSEQDILDKLKASGAAIDDWARQYAKSNAHESTGVHVYRELASKLGSEAAASRALADAGIPGLRYFDAGSRGKGDGTRNVVMFRDDLIKIEGVE